MRFNRTLFQTPVEQPQRERHIQERHIDEAIAYYLVKWRTQEKIAGGSRLWTASQVPPRTPEKFRKFAKNILKKIAKKCIILAYFSKEFQNHAF